VIANPLDLARGDIEELKSAGAVGLVIRPWLSADPSIDDEKAIARAKEMSEAAWAQGIETLWEVHSPAQARSAVAAGAAILLLTPESTDAASADASLAGEWRAAAGGRAAVVAQLRAMQAGNAEVAAAGALRTEAGAGGIALLGACVGDGEDAEYARWATETLASKASQEFRITGMTGHVNGHYGTGTFERATGERQWRRTGGAAGWAPASNNAAGRKSAPGP
jgi:hypothetical protein